MKRNWLAVVSTLLAVCLLACLGAVAAADEAVPVTFTVLTESNIRAGQTVKVSLNVAQERTMIGAIGFAFSYDETYLEPVMDPETERYFVTGPASGGATAVGNEKTMQVQMASVNGFKAPGTVVSVFFKVKQEIPIGTTARVSAAVTVEPTDNGNRTTVYNVTMVAGGVRGLVYPEELEQFVASLPEVGDLTEEHEEQVLHAYNEYCDLLPAQQEILRNRDKLLALVEALKNIPRTAVLPVTDAIAALPAPADITPENAAAVQTARVQFAQLTLQQQSLVQNAAALTEAVAAVRSQTVRGDVNGDKLPDARDALLVLQAAVGKRTLSDMEAILSDLNDDVANNAKDALIILKIAVGKA